MRRHIILRTCLATALTLAVALTAGVHAQETRELGRRLDAVRIAAADRDLPATEIAVRAFLAAEPGLDAGDEARLLVAKARLAKGQTAQALAAVDPIVERAASPWHVKALYLVAEASSRTRDWKRAADVYAERVDEIASDEHAAITASLYREIADGAFEGEERPDAYGRMKRVRDWAGARRFYEKARGVHVPEADRALVAFRIGLSALESGDPRTAIRELETLTPADAVGVGDVADDALYALGRARLAASDRPGARSAFEELRDRFGDSEFASLSLIRTGETWWTGGGLEAARRATDAWSEFLRLYPAHDEAAGVLLRIGDTWRSAGRPEEASAAFLDFVAKFGEHEQAPSAQDRAASSRLALDDFDGAVRQWRVLLDHWPDHPLWAQAQSRVAEASYLKGSRAFDQERDADARTALEAFLAAFPVDGHAPGAQRLLGDLSKRSGDLAAAVEAWRLCATKYPQSADAPIAMLAVAGAYEGALADLDAALAAYEETAAKWPHTQQANEARRIMGEMKARTLRAVVKRAFRTDEKSRQCR